ncbi:hypothetical protein EIKCOROL_00188 [Eikenella corrodens ATCC 23834]|uniref:Uncharacterized protein n=1 Tax=Eikenella corrodens ATCC 23834 TaxID=546274 RepID=C0DS66_EIKCO|nr:hypothetical protein EIKCOROL_00188 [Eikenella corrodens ATCC 23834]
MIINNWTKIVQNQPPWATRHDLCLFEQCCPVSNRPIGYLKAITLPSYIYF